ncbi:MAG: GIY-YIG nuclease family protein [Fusobacteriaceae bacterium]
MQGIIYKATFPNGKVYIGQTTSSIEDRKIQHVSDCHKGSKNKFHTAMRGYGIKNVVFEIECYCESKDLDRVEEEKITLYNSVTSGYNSRYNLQDMNYLKVPHIELLTKKFYESKNDFLEEYKLKSAHPSQKTINTNQGKRCLVRYDDFEKMPYERLNYLYINVQMKNGICELKNLNYDDFGRL